LKKDNNLDVEIKIEETILPLGHKAKGFLSE